ncbi:MAG: DnaB-like helicase C-terminal domain-containing protein [Desulfomicrobium sp.]|nr:DnaB-like helicase C-terminal domain-containing protein [Desulfomicrobium sp.]
MNRLKNRSHSGLPQISLPSVVNTTPPHDRNAEQALIGTCILRSERLEDVRPYVRPEDFYFPQHQVLFKAILRMADSHDIVDVVSLASALQTSGELDGVGGSVYLASLLEHPYSGNVSYWAATVRDTARRRRIMQLSTELFMAAANPTGDVHDVAAGASDLVDGVLADKLDTGRQQPREIVRDYQDWLDRVVDEQEGMALPFPKAQKLTGGFMPTELVYLAARPSNGKTALMLNTCLYNLGLGKRIGIVSLEMRSKILMSRMSAMALDIDAQKFRNRTLTPDDRAKINEFCRRMEQRSFRMWDEPEFSPVRMRSVIKSWKRQMGGLDFLVIDYLQLLDSDPVDGRMASNREQEVSRISKAIKRLALGEELPVMVLCQLSRQAEKDSKPMLSHLRESGSLEQDADFVLFLSFWDPRTVGHEIDLDLDIAKGRSSQTGTVPLTYVRPFLRFHERPEGM